ncbi:MAG: ATP-dependent sacrificial sulfur transferase LarE [Candidatus Kariarchaeaceae archaeon]|jgi:uncharacterized protein
MSISLEITDENTIKTKLNEIKKIFINKKVVVSFSGGVDSSVIAYLSKKYAQETLLVMQVGYSVGIGEREIAAKQAEQLSLPIDFIEYDEIDYSSEFQANPDNRCYYCKDLLYTFLEKIRERENYDIIASGTNSSDLLGHRPGYQASLDLGVLNPLVMANITKQEVRWIARESELLTWDKTATACLASRFPTGIPITKEGLERVGRAEYELRKQFGIKVLRVRHHDKLARIEVGADELSKILNPQILERINHLLKGLGYNYVTIDLESYRPATPIS